MENMYEIVLDGKKTSDYIRGRISGIIYVLTRKPDKGFPWKCERTENRWTLTTVCSEEVFNDIIETINRVYPGVIIEE